MSTMAQVAYAPDEELRHGWDEYYEQVVTEDDIPVDNLFSTKQQRLLTRALYASWTPPPRKHQAPEPKRSFLADCDIGVFYALHKPPRVPDFFLSLDVQPAADWYEKKNRSYFLWEFGKPPEVVLEIVSNRAGGELDCKPDDYAEMSARYYVVYDPQRKLSEDVLQVFELRDGEYCALERPYLPRVGLGLTLWYGVFEGKEDEWLRWCDAAGKVIPTGEERAALEAEARRQAESRAAQAEDRAARLAAKLRELGLEPE